MTTVRNDKELLTAIKDSLNTNLSDPRYQYTGVSRSFVHDDRPLITAQYPRIQVRKREPSISEIIDLGMDFMEWRIIVLDIQFWTKAPFKWKQADGTYIQDEGLVREWLHKIWVTIKADFPNLKADHGLTGFKMMTEGDPYVEADTQLFTGTVSIRAWYFTEAAS